MKISRVLGFLIVAISFQAEAAPKNGMPAVDLDPQSAGIVASTGIEMRDVIGMSDLLVRDILQRPDIVNSPVPPRIILEGSRIRNESSQRINTNILSDQLRSRLIRAAAGRLRFLSRENLQDVLDEKEAKTTGMTDVGTRGRTRAVAGADYRLVGRITSIDSRDGMTGATQRAMQVVFELIDLETTDTVYISEPYVLLRASRAPVANQ